MKTIAEIQAKNGLWRALWEVAVDEAYTARDSQRRTDEINGLPERGVVDVYLTYHPEMREWADNHIKAGTCEAGINELRETLQVVRVQRAADRQRAQQLYLDGVPTAPVPADPDDWMAPFKSGPAIWPTNPPPLVIEPEPSAVEPELIVTQTVEPPTDEPIAMPIGTARTLVKPLRPIPRRRGPDPVKRKEAIRAMIEAVEDGTISTDELVGMKGKTLVRFNPEAKRTMLVEAREEALQQLTLRKTTA